MNVPTAPQPGVVPPVTGDGASDAPPTSPPARSDRPAEETVTMRSAAGDAPPLAGDVAAPKERKEKKKKKKEKTVEMAGAAPASGATPTPDEALESLGTKRGIETMFRTSYRTNMDLTALADAKANIMISINGLIVSILIASIAPKVDANPWLLAPTSLFLVGCLVSLIFAVLAARPRVQSRTVTLEEVRRNRTNVLFFGNFAHMSERDYVQAMKEMIVDPTNLYELMIKDVYGIGSVLQKKYTLLRTSYGAFLVALTLGVVGFILIFGYAAFFEAGPSTTTVYTAPPDAVAPGLLP